MEKSVTVMGSLNYDIVASAERLPYKGETVQGYGFDVFTGGKGANQSVQIALLGLKCVFIGQVGGDAQGQTVLTGIKEKGVDARFVRVSPEERTGCALITVAPDGSNTLVLASGANHHIERELVDAAAESIRTADMFITQNEINQDALRHGVRIAHEAGVKILLNPAPAVPLTPEIFQMLDYIAPNEIESEIYTGIAQAGKSPEQWRQENAQWFLERGVKNVCITLGSQGAYFSNGQEECYRPAFPITPVDTTAAGDSFIGGFTFGLIRGWPVEKVLTFANACGSVSVMTKGAQNSLQPYRRIEQFLKGQGVTL